MNWQKVIEELHQGVADCSAQIRRDEADLDFDEQDKRSAKTVILTVQGVLIALAEALSKGVEKH